MQELAMRWLVNGAASGEPMKAETAVTVLNELFAADPEGATRLFNARVPVNDAVADHPTIVCRPLDGGGHELGVIGVLNGILSREDPCGSGVAALQDVDTKALTGFTAVRLRG